MNRNKSRDFYSAYYEGTLDAGLTQAFERSLANEAEVKAEYQQFVRIMDELKELREPITVPENLHLLIRERVDAHIIATERKSKVGSVFFAWRPLAYGAVAAAAIIGVVMSISNPVSNSGVATGSFFVRNSAPTVVMVDGVARLRFASSGQNDVTITDVSGGELLYRISLENQSLDSPLSNLSDEAVLVKVEFASDYSTLLVGVHGKVRLKGKAGIGDFNEFVKAVASAYKVTVVVDATDVVVPVVVDATDVVEYVIWQFETEDVVSSISEELKELGLQAEVRDGLQPIALHLLP